MHAAVAALARRHGLAPTVASEIDAVVTHLAGAAAGGAGAAVGAEPDPTLFLPASPPVAATEPGGASSRYEVVGELGRGGMGEVQRVVDRWLNRAVARKVMHPRLSDADRSRFLEEAQATAQLQHPGIVPVYDVGEEPDGRLWFTMKEVRGETLRAVIRGAFRRPPDRGGEAAGALRRLVTMFHAVCQAVGYAHERGVVHRDLKPSNVMVGAHGEVLVLDWGIAKVLSSAGGAPGTGASEGVHTFRGNLEHTLSGSVFGTPSYMSPEQARGEVEAIDARSDVYALGAVLYEILSGAAPYRVAGAGSGESAGQAVVAQVVAGPPPPLRGEVGARGRATFGVDLTELVEVCERAMSRAPEDRYATATALGAAVQSWLDGSRRREQALAVVDRAAAQRPTAAALRSEAAALRAAAAAAAGLATWQPEDDKVAVWAKEDEAAALEARASLAELEEESLLRASLTHAPELPEAHAALAERYRREHAAREIAREDVTRPEVLLREHLAALPEGHPVRRSGVTYLQGDGALTLVTDPPGAEVWLSRYEARNRRLVAVPVRSLGRTPLRAVSLPMGSYLCELRHPERAPVRYPVFVGRGEHWDGAPPEGGAPLPVPLPRPEALGPDDCYVPAGWFWSGGDPATLTSLPRRRLWLDGQVFRRFPITNREYLGFLDALVAEGRAEEALRHVPRERAGTAGEPGALIYGFDGRRFSLRPDGDGDRWDPEWPVVMVEWAGARAFAAWEAERTGRPWGLPGDLAWEKAARGVDGRCFPWGDAADPSWACLRESHRGRSLPAVVDSYPVDVSVYGVRGLAGNVIDWCADRFRQEGPTIVDGRVLPCDPAEDHAEANRIQRGSNWGGAALGARCAHRNRAWATTRTQFVGFRLARPFP